MARGGCGRGRRPHLGTPASALLGRVACSGPGVRSQGRLVTVAEAATLLEILAREDRSAVAGLPGAETVPWT
jgi:hypothetical protein